MKKALGIAYAAATFLSLVPSAFAANINICASAGQFSLLCGLSASSFGSILGQLISLLFVLAIVAALLFLVWGGFKWLTSGGDKAAVQSAREHILAAIIGLVVIFLSYFILNILVLFFTGVNISNITIPTLGTP